MKKLILLGLFSSGLMLAAPNPHKLSHTSAATKQETSSIDTMAVATSKASTLACAAYFIKNQLIHRRDLISKNYAKLSSMEVSRQWLGTLLLCSALAGGAYTVAQSDYSLVNENKSDRNKIVAAAATAATIFGAITLYPYWKKWEVSKFITDLFKEAEKTAPKGKK